MFRKTIAVLLVFLIVLSSCGKKDKDKSNDFLRVTTPPPPTTNSQLSKPNKTGVVKPYLEALNDCINIHMSCPVHSEACHEAQDKDPDRTYSLDWQYCLDSKICPEFKEDFLKAQLDCFASEVDYLVAKHACYEARLACPNPNLFSNCPESELVCDKYNPLKPKTLIFLACPKYVPASSNPKYAEYSEAEKKYTDAKDKAWEVCSSEYNSSVCWKTRVEKVALNIPYIKAQKACLESEPNDTNPS